MKLAAMLLLAASSIPSMHQTQGTEVQFQRPKSIVKTTHLGTNAVVIVCTNGAEPSGKTVDKILIVSCAKGQ